jgi:hypothetical protein
MRWDGLKGIVRNLLQDAGMVVCYFDSVCAVGILRFAVYGDLR